MRIPARRPETDRSENRTRMGIGAPARLVSGGEDSERSVTIAPMCTRCGVVAVRRHLGSRIPKRGRRVVDGLTWQWFCSVACGNAEKGALMPIATAARRKKAFDRALARLMAACKGEIDSEGRVPVKAFVKAFMRELRREHANGETAEWRRRGGDRKEHAA